MNNQELTDMENLAIETVVSYWKQEAAQIADPTVRLAAFGAAVLRGEQLRQRLLKERQSAVIHLKQILNDLPSLPTSDKTHLAENSLGNLLESIYD